MIAEKGMGAEETQGRVIMEVRSQVTWAVHTTGTRMVARGRVTFGSELPQSQQIGRQPQVPEI